MTYYSTGKSPYMPIKGKAVENVLEATAESLVKRGFLVRNKEDLFEPKSEMPKEVIERETKVQIVEQPKKRGNPRWAKK